MYYKKFLAMYRMEFIDIMMHYSSGTKGCCSIIGYICTFSYIVIRHSIINYGVVSSAYNFSDHEPIEIKLNISLTSDTGAHAGDVDRPNNDTGYAHTNRPAGDRFRFDHANVDNYYDYT